jgi:saccharopine dehydrogenase-like NADP-dependent oxidoreductase
LRSLLRSFPDVPEMGEKTLRWPGHAKAVQPLIETGTFLEEFEKNCVVDAPRDVVAMVVRMRWSDAALEATLVNRFDPGSGLSAMGRTTACTTAVVARLVANGAYDRPGVVPLELVGEDSKAYDFILDEMKKRGVDIQIEMS